MQAVILDVGSPVACHPLTCTRPLAAIPVANQPLAVAQHAALAHAGFVPAARPAPGRSLYLCGDAWVSAGALGLLLAVRDNVVLRDAEGEPLAWVGTAPAPAPDARPLPADAVSFRLRYPWDLLRLNEVLLAGLTSHIEGDLSPQATVAGCLLLGPGSCVLPGAYIEGQVLIGANCKVGPNCYLRGATSIGDNCHVGQAVEIKNSIVMHDSSVAHLTYCGDSIIGAHANLGAGTITSNFRHDGRPHRSLVAGALVDTGRVKLGAILGDGVHTGIHTSIYPGRKLWPGVWTRPGAVVQHDLTAPTL